MKSFAYACYAVAIFLLLIAAGYVENMVMAAVFSLAGAALVFAVVGCVIEAAVRRR